MLGSFVANFVERFLLIKDKVILVKACLNFTHPFGDIYVEYNQVAISWVDEISILPIDAKR